MKPTLPSRIRASRWYATIREMRHVWRHRARRSFYRRLIPAHSTVFDIGANAGHYARIFCSLGAKVVAVEPQWSLTENLQTRFSREIAKKRFWIENCALGAAAGTAQLTKSTALDEIASLRPDIAEVSRFSDDYGFDQHETVRVSTLDALIKTHGTPAFCKIDVEGFEDEVLKGLTVALPRVSFEFNREFLTVTSQCLEYLDGLAAYRFNFVAELHTNYSTPEWQTAAQLQQTLTHLDDPLAWGDVYAIADGIKP